jgi:hypothetical protein
VKPNQLVSAGFLGFKVEFKKTKVVGTIVGLKV